MNSSEIVDQDLTVSYAKARESVVTKPKRVDLIDCLVANSRLCHQLINFRSWQTNYPDSRPELNETLDALIEKCSATEKTLIAMEKVSDDA